jgi:hypothetical protein
MRVRLPNSRELDGEELMVFQSERERIDALLEDGGMPAFTLASN